MSEHQREGLDVRVDCSVMHVEKRNGVSRLVRRCSHPNNCVFQIHGIHLRAQNAQRKGECVEAELGHQSDERDWMIKVVTPANLSKTLQRRPQVPELGLQVSKPKCSSWKRKSPLPQHYSTPSSTYPHVLSNVQSGQRFTEHALYHSSPRSQYTQ